MCLLCSQVVVLVVTMIIMSAVPAVNAFQVQEFLRNDKLQSSTLTSRGHATTVISTVHECYFKSSISIKSCLYSEKRGNNNGKTKFGQKTDEDVSRFLTDFRTADGTVVDPYKILQVSRTATTIEIKQSYRRLSRKLHPDMVAQMEILPGRCTNLDDVRDEWEKVKFSYEILSDSQMRKNYDRNSSVAEVLNDPGAAVGRAVVGGAMSGLGIVLGGAWKLGEMAAKTIYETAVVVSDEGKGGDSERSKKISIDESFTSGDIGDGVNENVNPSKPQSSAMFRNPTLLDIDSKQTNQASCIDISVIESSVMVSKPRNNSSDISATGSYLSQINPPKSSSAVETAPDLGTPNKEDIDVGNAMNVLTANNANAQASGASNKKSTRRKGSTKGFGK